jgi:hypothetical protein
MQSLGHNRLNISGRLWFAGHISCSLLLPVVAMSRTNQLGLVPLGRTTSVAKVGLRLSSCRASTVFSDRVAFLPPRQEGLSHAEPVRGQIIRLPGSMKSREPALEPFEDAARREIDNDLMMPHPLPAFDGTEVSHEAIMAIAHSSQAAVSEHVRRMHYPVIPSNLDGGRLG